ncbi:ribosomal RNA assembly protein [Enteropsectra breve]|nr:ribosomal RNA assembly protein [Enteropsectra breve]
MEKKKTVEVDFSKIKHAFLETSSFDVLFSKQRMEYLKSVELYITKACEQKKISFSLECDSQTMRVSTTKHTRDPYIIIKAYEMIQLLAKGVNLEHAVKNLEDDVFSEIIPINLLCSSEKVYERRRARIMNPKILKALELLTKTYILIASKAACIVGPQRGVNQAKQVIISCFENIHPAYEIKNLVIKKNLEKEGSEGSWERFLPKIVKTHSKNKKEGRVSGGMPQDILPRKTDLEKETGEYYLNPKNIEKEKKREQMRKKREEMRKAAKEKYDAPDE